MPGLIDLPETSALPSISRRFRMVLRFVPDNPFGHLRIYASGFGGDFNIGRTLERPLGLEANLLGLANEGLGAGETLSTKACAKEVQMMPRT